MQTYKVQRMVSGSVMLMGEFANMQQVYAAMRGNGLFGIFSVYMQHAATGIWVHVTNVAM